MSRITFAKSWVTEQQTGPAWNRIVDNFSDLSMLHRLDHVADGAQLIKSKIIGQTCLTLTLQADGDSKHPAGRRPFHGCLLTEL
jgi:hypothetical protein